MRDNRVARSASMSVAQVLVSGGVLFLLYRYLLSTIGSEKLGIWAVVLATASASRISEMGMGGSAVKFTARYISRGEIEKAAQVIQTTIVTIGVVLACVLVAGYPVILLLMEVVVPAAHWFAAPFIFPFALVSVRGVSIAGAAFVLVGACRRAGFA